MFLAGCLIFFLIIGQLLKPAVFALVLPRVSGIQRRPGFGTFALLTMVFAIATIGFDFIAWMLWFGPVMLRFGEGSGWFWLQAAVGSVLILLPAYAGALMLTALITDKRLDIEDWKSAFAAAAVFLLVQMASVWASVEINIHTENQGLPRVASELRR